MIKKFSSIGIVILSLSLSCSSFAISDRREGFIEGSDVFRVYIQFEDYEYRDADAIKKINDKILSDSALRFADLINAIALECSNREDRDSLELFVKKNDSIRQVRYKKIGDEDVSCFVDVHLPGKISNILSLLSTNKKDISTENE